MPHVTILYDAVPADAPTDTLDVLWEADGVERVLRSIDWTTDRLDVGLDLGAAARALIENPPDLVFNLVETVGGAARLVHFVPALLDHLGVPYTGSGADAMYTTANKRVAGKLLRLADLPVPAPMSAAATRGRAGAGRWIVKSVWEHASIGIHDESVVDDPARARTLMAARREQYGGEWFAEEYVDGREFNVTLIAGDDGPEVLQPAEIQFIDYPPDKPRIVNYAAKWDTAAFEYRNSERVFPDLAAEPLLLAELRRLALACWDLFGLGGYARVDFRVDAAGRPWVLDINANPCVTPDGGFAAALENAGLTYEQGIARIAQTALRRAATGAVRT